MRGVDERFRVIYLFVISKKKRIFVFSSENWAWRRVGGESERGKRGPLGSYLVYVLLLEASNEERERPTQFLTVKQKGEEKQNFRSRENN
jgi:hypothetical protein